jgi:hypothetical protein
MDPQQVLAGLNFGRVDAESDSRFESCFIGTDMLRHILQPQHSLILGSKGSGKSAAFRLLCTDKDRVKPLFPKGYEEIFCIPVYGLQNEEYVYGTELSQLRSNTIDDFRYFWLLIIGLKTVTFLTEDPRVREFVSKSKNPELKEAYKMIQGVVEDLELAEGKNKVSKLKHRITQLLKPHGKGESEDSLPQLLAGEFRHKTGMSVGSMLDKIDMILWETKCLAWIMLDKLDLLFIEDFEKLKSAVTGLVQLLIEHSNRFKNIQFKIFLRTDLYRQLRIVNKSHLVSYTTEMKWRGPLLLKLLVARAVADPSVQQYCEEQTGEPVDVPAVVNGSDDDVLRWFYVLFESTMSLEQRSEPCDPFIHVWMLKYLADGMGNVYPREQIHLGNLAVGKQLDINRGEGSHQSTRLISARALKEAFAQVSVYRCDTYLYSEFPHLSKHFDVFRGADRARFTRDELYEFFQTMEPSGDEAIRAVYDTGLLAPLGRTVDSSMEFRIPLLYRTGLGITQRGNVFRPIPQGPSVTATETDESPADDPE